MSECKLISRRIIAAFVIVALIASAAQAEIKLTRLFGDHMVLQRDKAVPVFGSADVGEKVTVSFGGKKVSDKADWQGRWQVELPAMKANTKAQDLTISGSNTIVISDVLVGDVWLCSGQSNMEWRLRSCDRQVDIDSANFPGIRHFAVPVTPMGQPTRTVRDDLKWDVCTPKNAGGFSAVAFYFARKIYKETDGQIPVGLLHSSVGGTKIDAWLAPDGIYDDPVLQELVGLNPISSGVSQLYNGMIHPLAPYGICGAIWYQGESGEVKIQSPDSYYLKMKALINGWKRVWGMDELPFYFVMLANYGHVLDDVEPIFFSNGWNADTRLQQVNAMSLPFAGCGSALDLGVSQVSWPGYHPKNKLDVGDRLALWALKDQYGKSDLVVSGPVLRDVTVSQSEVICSFDYVGSGLMVGMKEWYKPTAEVAAGKLDRFVIAGQDGKWYKADAKIKGDTVVLSSESVAKPVKVSYACWQNPEGCNLYNKEGLPASPFHVDDVTEHYAVSSEAGKGGSITPAGKSQYLRRMAAGYKITPKRGYYVKDVKVDGVSVGAVTDYTFDPLYADHNITAEFTRWQPKYNISVASGKGGKVVPSGKVKVKQGKTAEFIILPQAGNVASVTVDGVDLGERYKHSFVDVDRNHSIAVAFQSTIKVSAGFGGTISPSNTMEVEPGQNQRYKVLPMAGFAVASVKVDGVELGAVDSYEFKDINSSHSIDVKFRKKGKAAGPLKIPRKEELIFACRANSLPDKGALGNWASEMPTKRSFGVKGIAEVKVIDGKKYVDVVREKAPCINIGHYEKPIACDGASIVAVVRPVRNGVRSGLVSVVDVFYDQLVLGVQGDTGKICIRAGGNVITSDKAIADGQITILSFVVERDGKFKVFANGQEIMAGDSGKQMTSLVPGTLNRGFAKQITLGRNAPDAWTAYNGQIGDVFLYKTALTDSQRKGLEALIIEELSGN
jgi:sialate O-acetylesterase